MGLNYTNNQIGTKMADKSGYDYGLQISISNFVNYKISSYANNGLGMVFFVHNNQEKRKMVF